MRRELVQRIYFGGVLSQVVSTTVLAEDERGRLLALPAGTPVKRTSVDRPLREIPRDDWPPGGFPLEDARWFGNGVLIFQPTGEEHSVWWFFTDDNQFAGWYVNLETRNADGTEIVDQELDVWVYPDRSWSWKDEESFQEKTGDPRFWTQRAAARIRAEAEKVIRRAELGEFPFDGTWCDVRP